jgi:hypothetical protein
VLKLRLLATIASQRRVPDDDEGLEPAGGGGTSSEAPG